MHGEVAAFMSRRQLAALFVCSLVPWTIGNGLTPLLPVYATTLGASSAEAGCQLALMYGALAAGMLAADWVSQRLRGRKVLIFAAGALGTPTMWLMGYAQDSWQLAAVSAVWCLWAGMGVAQANVLAGLSAAQGQRGKVFGLLSMNPALGALCGGLAMGTMAARCGYAALFRCLSLFGLLWPVAACFLQDGEVERSLRPYPKGPRNGVGMGRGFHALLLASFLATLAAYLFIGGRSLIMLRLGFHATSISSTSALSEVPVLPLPMLLGWLSDRFGRKRFLLLGYLAASAGLLAMAASAHIWHFWISSVLVTTSLVTGTVGSALAADLVPREALGKGLSLLDATTPVAGILGHAASGCAVQYLGSIRTFVPAALLPLMAAGLLLTSGPARLEPGVAKPPAGSTAVGNALPAAA